MERDVSVGSYIRYPTKKIFSYDSVSFVINFNSPVEFSMGDGFSPGYFRLLNSESGEEEGVQYGSFSILLNQDSCEYVVWPNREGEIFDITQAVDFLERHGFSNRGVYINYPATASCRGVILVGKGGGVIIAASPDGSGRVSEFRLKLASSPVATDQKCLEILVRGPTASPGTLGGALGHSSGIRWVVAPYRGGWGACERKIREVLFAKSPVITKGAGYRYMLQVGLVDQQEKTEVDPEEGFMVLERIARVMKEKLGMGNILHVFGYGRGHDVGYPDYSPSKKLGGKTRLAEAIEGIHRHGQVVSLYMNGRIADAELVDADTRLAGSVLLGSSGKPVFEFYTDRKFYVMDPSSTLWIDRLVEEASRLRDLGADIVQLDQLGGRKAPLPPGSEWGKGYVSLIERIHDLGLEVWIQGLSDLYNADWFEATYRETSILEDGSLRGGMPFGKPFLKFFRMMVPGKRVLVPLSKLKEVGFKELDSYIVDLEDEPGKTFFYKPDYLKRFSSIVGKIKRIENGVEIHEATTLGFRDN